MQHTCVSAQTNMYHIYLCMCTFVHLHVCVPLRLFVHGCVHMNLLPFFAGTGEEPGNLPARNVLCAVPDAQSDK